MNGMGRDCLGSINWCEDVLTRLRQVETEQALQSRALDELEEQDRKTRPVDVPEVGSTELLGIMGTNATIWAREWLKTIRKHPKVPTDEGTMIGWFANAIMAGHDAAMREAEKRAVDE